MDKGRHAGRGRARHPRTGYLALDRSRRQKILWDLVLGRAVYPADEPYAREKAERTVAKLPGAILAGISYGLLIAATWSSLFPLTVGTVTLMACLGVAVVIYLAGLSFAIRMWMRLRRR